MPSAFPRHRSFVTVSGAYVCTYGYKLSLTATLSLSPTPPASLRCRPASVPLSTRNLRLLFRLVDAVPLLSILRSARAANLHVPPTHRGCCPCHSVRRLHFIIRDERIEVIACGTLFICRREQNVGGFDYRPHPERGFCNGFLPLNTSVARIPSHRRLRAFLAEVPLLSTSAKNRCVLRVERL